MTRRRAEAAVVPADAPKRIWLQLGPEKPERDAKFRDYYEVTWCSDSIDDYDIEYVRADLAASRGKQRKRGRG